MKRPLTFIYGVLFILISPIPFHFFMHNSGSVRWVYLAVYVLDVCIGAHKIVKAHR